jgi:hypothetical protein
MKKIEWIREAVSVLPSPEHLKQRETAGWRLAAVEWEREVQAEPTPTSEGLVSGEEIPYGTRIAGDCLHLECRFSITWQRWLSRITRTTAWPNR